MRYYIALEGFVDQLPNQVINSDDANAFVSNKEKKSKQQMGLDANKIESTASPKKAITFEEKLFGSNKC